MRVDQGGRERQPAKAIMDPIERSNSPPIISSAAAIARMPSCEAGAKIVIAPLSVNMVGLAVKRKKTRTTISPATAPSSGLRIASVRSTSSADVRPRGGRRRGRRDGAIGLVFLLH